jgi:hypothetical protein
LKLKEQVEGLLEQVRAELQAANIEKQQLQQEVQRRVMVAGYFRSCIKSSCQGVNDAFLLLEKVKIELSSVSEEQDLRSMDPQCTYYQSSQGRTENFM